MKFANLKSKQENGKPRVNKGNRIYIVGVINSLASVTGRNGTSKINRSSEFRSELGHPVSSSLYLDGSRRGNTWELHPSANAMYKYSAQHFMSVYD